MCCHIPGKKKKKKEKKEKEKSYHSKNPSTFITLNKFIKIIYKTVNIPWNLVDRT
jgi:hypothetical protein